LTVQRDTVPPGFLRLAGHPLRWRLLSELARSDRQVRELKVLTGERQSLVSYHLGQLRAGGLVTTRRSSADRRDAYYRIDLARCAELLAAAGAALHPGLRLVPPPAGEAPGRVGSCSCAPGTAPAPRWPRRSPNIWAGNTITAASAGSHPKTLHPNAVRVMREHGIDITGRQAKHVARSPGSGSTT
jgi:DNA-binding transcriptional ArsR family regulator